MSFDLQIEGGESAGEHALSTANVGCGYGPESGSYLVDGLENGDDGSTISGSIKCGSVTR